MYTYVNVYMYNLQHDAFILEWDESMFHMPCENGHPPIHTAQLIPSDLQDTQGQFRKYKVRISIHKCMMYMPYVCICYVYIYI